MDLQFRAWLHSGAEHWRDEIKKRSVYPEYKPLCFQWNYLYISLIFKNARFLTYSMLYIFMWQIFNYLSGQLTKFGLC